MPNYCDNQIKISGKIKDIKKFYEFCISDNRIDFDKIEPEPKNISEILNTQWIKKDALLDVNNSHLEFEKIFDWFNWRYQYWGTKWNACDGCLDYLIEDLDDIILKNGNINFSLYIYFFTPWCPPKPIYKKIIKLFPELTFENLYYECGNMFAGEISGSNGEITNEEYYEGEEAIRWAVEKDLETEEAASEILSDENEEN